MSYFVTPAEMEAGVPPAQPVTVEDHGAYLTITFPDIEGRGE